MQSLMLTFITLATLLLSQNAYAVSNVTAVVDKNPAMLNESILLTITADDDVSRNALDTSPLLKDFIVGQTSVSSQTSVVNFKTTRMTKWQVVLIARAAGKFIIPALSIENRKTSPIQLSVIKAKNNSGTNQNDIFITSELSSNEVYVQQSLTLSIKLHFAVELHSASMDSPEFTGAIIEKMGEDQQSDGIINGKRYRIIEQTYAITPEQSGEFTLKAPVFSGEVRQGNSNNNRRSSFFNYAQTKPVSVVGNALKLSVLPIPVNYPNNEQWLPTDILTLHQELQGTDGEFTVGEPITRTVRLTAAGLSKAQLPKLTMENSHGLKVYPDQAELHSTVRKNKLISQKVQNFALVPSSAGDFTLPEMSVTWFNTITNKIEKATLPSQTINVKPSLDSMAPNAIQNQPVQSHTDKHAEAMASTVDCSETVGENIAPATNTSTQGSSLQWLFLALWLLTTLAWIIHAKFSQRHTKQNTKTITNNNTGHHYLSLIAACKKNDAEQALNLTLPWLKQLLANQKQGQDVNNIAQALVIINESSFDEALNALQQYLYGKDAQSDSTPWQGFAFLNAVQKVNKQQGEKSKASAAISLNP